METGAPAERYVIDTASGMRLDLDNPRPEDIRVEDVAGGLSKVCRFGAQALEYYSVAQHALLVQHLIVEAGHPELALAALHHDSHEAYLRAYLLPSRGRSPQPLTSMTRSARRSTA